MSPILGIYASSNQGQYISYGSFEPIATVTASGSSNTVTFSSIPNTYKHLQLRCLQNNATVDRDLFLRFNSDTNTNYSMHALYGFNGGSVLSYGGSNVPGIEFGYNYVTSGFNSAYYVASIIDILDYTSTNKNKTVRILEGVDYNGSGSVFIRSGAWYNSSTAISTISFITNSGGNILANSSFALYGIKG